MGAGAVFLLFVVLIVVAIVVGVLYAVRAGLWARETSPTAAGKRDRGGRPEHVAVEDEGSARFDVSDRGRSPRDDGRSRRETDPTRT